MGNLNQKGKTKLTEECGELVTVLAKIEAFGSMGEHWDGKGSLKERLEDEIADVEAACQFVAEASDLDLSRIHYRRIKKVTLFQFWNAGGEASKLPELIVKSSGYPYCHGLSSNQEEWCDRHGLGGFMGHVCKPKGYDDPDQEILRKVLGL